MPVAGQWLIVPSLLLNRSHLIHIGHCHPAIIAALTEQAQKLTLSSRAFHTSSLGPFSKLLTELTGFEMALLMNTGAEAVESAIKLARKWAYKVGASLS